MLVIVVLCSATQLTAFMPKLLGRQLAHCLSTIGSRHFTTQSRNLLFSLPVISEKRHIPFDGAENFALKEFHDLVRWSILVSLSSGDDKPKKPSQYDNDIHSSYILFTRQEPNNTIISTVTHKLKYFSTLRSWDPKAMFILVLIPEDEIPDQV